MEHNPNGRQHQWKKFPMEDWKVPSWICLLRFCKVVWNGMTTLMEDDLNGIWPQWNMTAMEENLIYVLASQFCTVLGPAQPQLVSKLKTQDRRNWPQIFWVFAEFWVCQFLQRKYCVCRILSIFDVIYWNEHKTKLENHYLIACKTFKFNEFLDRRKE